MTIVTGVYGFLHCRPFMLCLQVIVANITYLLLVYIPNVLFKHGSLAQRFVKSYSISTMFALVWRWLVMFLMILDRLLAIVFPFSYKKYTNSIMKVFAVLLFFYSILATLAPLADIQWLLPLFRLLTPLFNILVMSHCHLLPVLHSHHNSDIALGAITPVFMYAVMYVKARSL